MAVLDTANSLTSTFLERLALAVPVRPVVARAEFLTRTRDDLFTLSQRLMSSISPSALQDPANPVIVTVRGTFARGKKIIPDAAREHMLSLVHDFEGQKNAYELWRGIYNDRNFEIDFFNYIHWLEIYDHRKGLNHDIPQSQYSLSGTRAEFLSLRKHGGITFLHNDVELGKYRADIDIQLEGAEYPYAPCELDPSELTPLFKALSESYEWARRIKIEVKSEELMRYEPFAREIASMQLPSKTISIEFYEAAKASGPITPSTATFSMARGNIPIYGVNIARPDCSSEYWNDLLIKKMATLKPE